MIRPTTVLLDRNENHYGPSPACLDLLRDLQREFLHDYSRDFQEGSYSPLSRRLAALHGLDESRILLGYGCEDILKSVVHHFVRPGGALLVPSASWWYYHAVAGEAGGRTVEYPLVEGNTAYRYDLDRLLASRDVPDAALLVLATPNNPTGNRMAGDDLLTVLERFRGVPVVLDQAYHGFVGPDSPDPATLVERFPNLLVLRSFSKLYGLAGARIGYALLGSAFESFAKVFARNLGFNRLSERLALAALDDEEYYARVRDDMAADRARLYATLRAWPGVRAYDSDANFVLARFPNETIAPLETGLRTRGLVVKFFREPAFLDCARITIGTSAEMARLREAFAQVLPTLVTAVA